MKKLPRWHIAVAFLGILGIIFFNRIVTFTVNWLFFQETGYTSIFTTNLINSLSVFGLSFLSTFLFFFINIQFASQKSSDILIPVSRFLAWLPRDFSYKVSRTLALSVSLFVSFLVGMAMSRLWEIPLRHFNAVPFNMQDPLFGKDISYFMFSLPFYELVVGYLQIIFLITLIMVGGIYVFTRGSQVTFTKGFRTFLYSIDSHVRMHLGVLIAGYLLTHAAGGYFAIHNLVYKQNIIFGAAYTDKTILVPLMYMNIAAIAGASVFVLLFFFAHKVKPLISAIVAVIILQICQIALPPIIQRLVVAPNELAKESPYILKNIQATRQAYGLEEVTEYVLPEAQSLSAIDIEENDVTIKNVRLWDRGPLLSTFSQLQEIRTYYEFNAVDNDRYMINGEPRQIMVSARELYAQSLPNKNWINERLTFTHGYGAIAAPVNQVTPEGLPVLFVKDIPPQAEHPELEINQPEVYYGEIPNSYIITKTNAKEFNYPQEEGNVYETYEGTGGVELSSIWKRILYAIYFGSSELLLSSDITPESRILYNRQIVQRVARIAPFLDYDNDPYLVIADGKLYWIIDAYTSSSRYPYAEPVAFKGKSTNYIRNAVKVVVDAYNGSVTLYAADSEDPILQVYNNIYNGVTKDLGELPPALADNVRYPEDIFDIQTKIYRTYHMTDPQNFYNKEDEWNIPEIRSDGQNTKSLSSSEKITPRHLVMKLPGEEQEEYIFMLPFTPRNKDNLSAWMAARNDGDNYGEIVVYRFPKDSLVYGPKQIISRINQDATISQQISLWDQRGSQVIQGPLLVIPIEQSLLYMRPLYLQAENGKIPELKRVIVAYENNIAMGETLTEALADIFGSQTGEEGRDDTTQTQQQEESASQQQDATPSTQAELIQKAQQLYQSALQAQREGDWARYGDLIEELGTTLQQIQEEE